MKDNIKLVIFDLDGVLVDACEWHRVALNMSLLEVCNYEIPQKDHYSIFNGIPTKVKLKKLSEMGILKSSDHKKVYDLKQKHTVDIIEKNALKREEKIQMINRLKSDGIIVACFTNSIRRTADLMLRKTGILDLFDFTLTNEDVQFPKPDPEGYNFLVNKFDCLPEEVIIVEDSPKGLEAARASSCNVIQVKSPEEVKYEIFEEYLK